MHQLHREIDAASWCITREDLIAFEEEVREFWKDGGIPDDTRNPNAHHSDGDVGPTIYQVNEHFIKPRTLQAGGMSWALMRNPDGLKCDVFVTHCWAEGVFEFCAKVRRMWPPDAQHLYCCFLANPQNGDISELLGKDPMDSPFARAMDSARYLLVVPNCRVSIYRRLWCVFEAHLAIQRGQTILLPHDPLRKHLLQELAPGIVFALILTVLTFFSWLPLFQLLGDECSSTTDTCADPVRDFIGLSVILTISLRGYIVRVSTRLLVYIMLSWLGILLSFTAFQYAIINDSITKYPAAFLARQLALMAVAVVALQYGKSAASAKAVEREGDLLEFNTVNEAACTDDGDAQKIRDAIADSVGTIDETIRVLRNVGKYDLAIAGNLECGMSPVLARDGVGYLEAMAGACFFVKASYMLVNEWINYIVSDTEEATRDFSASWDYGHPCKITLSCMTAVGMVTVYFVRKYRGRATYAIDALLWSSCLTAVLNHFTDWLYVRFLEPYAEPGGHRTCYLLQCVLDTVVFFGIASYATLLSVRFYGRRRAQRKADKAMRSAAAQFGKGRTRSDVERLCAAEELAQFGNLSQSGALSPAFSVKV